MHLYLNDITKGLIFLNVRVIVIHGYEPRKQNKTKYCISDVFSLNHKRV